MKRLALAYLLETRPDGQALDPIARFHLRNGARLERINWLADLSPNGAKQSAGLMANYL
jgi:malonyl-CoA decarboxylase